MCEKLRKDNSATAAIIRLSRCLGLKVLDLHAINQLLHRDALLGRTTVPFNELDEPYEIIHTFP
jgi:hypothetical protein